MSSTARSHPTSVETYRSMCTLLTAHQESEYPGILVVRPGPSWRDAVIVRKGLDGSLAEWSVERASGS